MPDCSISACCVYRTQTETCFENIHGQGPVIDAGETTQFKKQTDILLGLTPAVIYILVIQFCFWWLLSNNRMPYGLGGYEIFWGFVYVLICPFGIRSP